MASAVWRTLHSQILRPLKFGKFHSSTPQTAISLSKGCASEIGKRGMASGRKMMIAPSKYEWTRFKNDLHFYILLSGIPLGSIIFYSNFILGEAELADIPEDYEPEHWEYVKHPISRWFARFVYPDPVKTYEMEAAKKVDMFESARHKAQKRRVQEMMKEHDDYRSYYFVPAVDPRFSDELRKRKEYGEHHELGTP